jgi:transposase InsO family protein
MEQVARNLTDYEDGFLIGKRLLIIDRDSIFLPAFRSIVGSSGVQILLTAYQAPNMNAYAERFVRSIKSECLDQMIFVGQRSLDRAIKEFVEHYHNERSHQGIGNRLVNGAEPQRLGRVTAKRRLGGMLSYYHRRAA